MKDFGTIHYNPNGRGNILSEGQIMDMEMSVRRRDNGNDVEVTAHSGKVYDFVRHPGERRWVRDFSQDYDGTLGKQSMYVATVSENMYKYTKREVDRAEEANKLLESLCYPSANTLAEMVKNHMDNSPVTTQDIHRANDIWGPNVAALKGKTTQRKTDVPKEEEFLPRRLNPEPQVLLLDIMFVDGEAFLVSRTEPLLIRLCYYIPSKKASDIVKCLVTMVKFYKASGYTIIKICCDKEGGVNKAVNNSSVEELSRIQLDTDNWGKHVPAIERDIRTAKECIRAMRHGLPYRLCRQIKHAIVRMGATAINGEPNQGSYDKRSPREVLLNRRMDARIDARIKTGAYVQVTVRNTDNTMKARTLDAIALEPIRNNQGTYRFFLLDTKRVITADHWKELPIPDSVI